MSLLAYAEDLFRGALARVSVRSRMAAHVQCDADHLHVDGREYPLARYRRIGLIAIGKAAISMSDALLNMLSAAPEALSRLEGIVVSGVLPAHAAAQCRYFVGGHPLPTEGSRQAAEAVLKFLESFGAEDLVIFAISGGASAMVERSLDPTASFDQALTIYRALLHSGLSISQMNCVRKHLSATKGGRLAVAASGATQITLLVSDVPGDDPSVIGSGPSLPDPSTLGECRAVLQILMQGSPGLEHILQSMALAETPKPGDAAFRRSFATCVLSSKHLLEAAGALAAADGFHVEIDNTCDDWDCARAAEYLLGRVQYLRATHRKVCVLSGGELSVPLPKSFGAGGRNQHFALACALRLQACTEPTTVLSAGTDGIDGNSPAAGAVVDNATCALALARGMDPRFYFDRFDSFTFFRRIGGAIVTGPTENNLRDLRILLSTDGPLNALPSGSSNVDRR